MTYLQRVLYADGLASLASAALVLAASGPVSQLTGLSQGHLTIAGMILVPFVLLVLATASRPVTPTAAVKAVIGLNVVWVAASLGYLTIAAPNALGYAFVIGQAVAVGVLAELEVIGLKKIRAATA